PNRSLAMRHWPFGRWRCKRGDLAGYLDGGRHSGRATKNATETSVAFAFRRPAEVALCGGSCGLAARQTPLDAGVGDAEPLVLGVLAPAYPRPGMRAEAGVAARRRAAVWASRPWCGCGACRAWILWWRDCCGGPPRRTGQDSTMRNSNG